MSYSHILFSSRISFTCLSAYEKVPKAVISPNSCDSLTIIIKKDGVSLRITGDWFDSNIIDFAVEVSCRSNGQRLRTSTRSYQTSLVGTRIQVRIDRTVVDVDATNI